MAGIGEQQQAYWDRQVRIRRRRYVKAWLVDVFTNVPLMLGVLLVGGLLFVAMYAPELAPRNPFEVRYLMTVDGQVTGVPFPPSSVYPLGSDMQGRDILSQILYGTRQTLVIGGLVVLTRLVVGLLAGAIAGWYQGTWADRVITSVGEFFSAFPTLILTIILIQLFDIRRGLSTFILALGMVGWAEIAQYLRCEFIIIKEQPYIEGARVIGLSRLSALFRHALPNVIPQLVVLTALEMSAVLLIQGELGFLDIFIGGGTVSTDIWDRPVTYLDVPEWGAMLAGSWRYIRNRYWIPLYPAMAFFVAIFVFNLLAEGLRRLVERGRVPVHLFYSRHTIALGAVVVLAVMAVVNNTGPRAEMMRVAFAFDEQRALMDIQELAGGKYGGRRGGSAEERAAAEWIAAQFQELGLEPLGDDGTYFQEFPVIYQELATTPVLAVEDKHGQPIAAYEHREDFREMIGGHAGEGHVAHAEVVFVGGANYIPEIKLDDLAGLNLRGRVIMTTGAGGYFDELARRAVEYGVAGILIPAPNRYSVRVKGSYLNEVAEPRIPVYVIHESVANQILEPTGRRMADLWAMEQNGERLPRFGTGSRVSMIVAVECRQAVSQNVLGYWPGTNPNYAWQTVVLSGHYDHMGRDPDGTVFYGAHDGVSGIATILETVRLWREHGFQPQRGVLFAAWGDAMSGMVGSRYFTQHPPSQIALSNIAGAIVLDSVGRGVPNDLAISKPGVPEARVLYFQVHEAAQRMGVVARETFGGSDEESFLNLGIPAVVLVELGEPEAWHVPSDTVENIRLPVLAEAGMVATMSTMQLSVGR